MEAGVGRPALVKRDGSGGAIVASGTMAAMSDGTHLLISFASTTSRGCAQALKELPLPNLQRLLARLSANAPDTGSSQTLTPPHERALARAHALYDTDGQVPWAAWQLRQEGRYAEGTAHALITPCHWDVGRDHIAMALPARLQLEAQESQALLEALRPYFVQDGLSLAYQSPMLWYAEGELLRSLACASLDRVAGRVVDPWLPRDDRTRDLRRLQQEMQMLLYTHPVNAEREARGQPTVNSFWLSGTGALPPGYHTPPEATAGGPPPWVRSDHRLRDAALAEDWLGWMEAWREIDANTLPRLLNALDRGRPVSLTLCGERHARTWAARDAGLANRLIGALRKPSVTQALEAL